MTTRSLPRRALVQFGIAAVATVLFVLLMKWAVGGTLDALDKSIALAIHNALDTPDNPVLDWIMIGFTTIGTNAGIAVAIVIVTFGLVASHHWRTALILGADALVAAVLNVLLKVYIQRPRPILFDEITRPETFSFPSGHAMSAMAVYGGLAAVLITLYPKRRLPIVAGAAVLIAGIGFSRVYLGVHWPFDVLAGFLAGVPLLVTTVHLLHRKNWLKLSADDNKVNIYSSS